MPTRQPVTIFSTVETGVCASAEIAAGLHGIARTMMHAGSGAVRKVPR